MDMKIKGNGNIQIGGDYNPQPKVSPYHPNAIRYPNCGQFTYRNNTTCGNPPCDHPIKSHFDEIEQKKVDGFAALVGLGGLFISFIVAHFLHKAGVKEAGMVAIMGFFWLYICSPKKKK